RPTANTALHVVAPDGSPLPVGALGELAITGAGLAVIGLAPGSIGLIVGTAIFAAGIAFMFPALLSVAVARVDETERGAVVGTTSAFLDLSFGLAPAVMGIVAQAYGFPVAFMVSALVAGFGAAVIVGRRRDLDLPVAGLHSPA
ncbi:MAG TPA: MFS transporter, partial [Candidatus Limnocylindrales bacterium]